MHPMLAQTKLLDQLDSLPDHLVGFVRLREAMDVTSFCGWLKGQTLFPRIYWHARERDREFATLGILHQITDERELASLHQQPRPAAGSWPRYYGGLAFDRLADLAGTPHWQPFGHCRFILPRIELIRYGKQTELVCNLQLPAEANARATELEAARAALRAVGHEAHLDEIAPLEKSRQDSPDYPHWEQMVSELTTHAHLEVQPKVVLARESRLECRNLPNPWDLLAALQPLSPACFHFAFQFTPESCFLAASPERLYRRHERELESEALAGTIIRTGEAERDAELAAHLFADGKNRLENRLVHADILTRLEGLAESASLSEAQILQLRRLQHLKRHIHATLQPEVSDAQLLTALHPTPAVGGTPRRKALAYLREHEPFHRGWYAGACGLISDDVAEFAVAIRCMLLSGSTLRLYAGAGIVAGSEPAAEWQELDDKLANLLGLLLQGNQA